MAETLIESYKDRIWEKTSELKGFDLENLNERQRKLLESNIFLLKMLGFGAVFHIVLYLYPDTSWLQEGFAGMITSSMNLLGYEFTRYGINIIGEGGGYRIVQDCLGWKSMMAFTGLMFASGKLRDNLCYLGAGLILIAFANFVRVVTTIHLSEAGIISFEVIHSFLWTWSLTAIVLVSWGVWLKYYRD